MFNEKRQQDDELKKLLREAWPADADRERATFLQRLKLVRPPDHPGLLCLPGKARKTNGNGGGAQNEPKQRFKNVASFVATWSFILIAVGLAIFGFRYISNTPSGVENVPGTGGVDQLTTSGAGNVNEKEIKNKYIYRFNGSELTGSRKLTIAQLNMEINRLNPVGAKVAITGMKEVTSYREETGSIIFNVIVYELEGEWQTQEEGEEEDFTPTP